MLTTRWEPFMERRGGMRQFRDEMSRLFESLGREWPALAASFPAMNVWQDDANVYVEAELPGMDVGDLEITVSEGKHLTLKGERKAPQFDKAAWHRQERGFGSFTRLLTLPVPVDADKVKAELVNGVLTLTLPKSAEAKPRKISVKAE